MAWQEIGTVTLNASSVADEVGTVTVPAKGGLEVRIQSLTPDGEAPYRAGLFYVRTTSGRTLGSRKFWGHNEGEDYVLGYSQSSEETTGTLVVEPRYMNLRSLSTGRTWTLRFWVQPLPEPGGTSSLPSVKYKATNGVRDLVWNLVIPKALARISF